MFGLFSPCKTMVKYSGTSIEIGTIKGPAKVPVKIGGVAIKPELLHTAGGILKILDWLQFNGCQRIQDLKKLKGIPQTTVADLILRQYEDARMIAYVAIISISACSSAEKFEKVLADWIAAALPRAEEWRKIIVHGEVTSGTVVRDEIEKPIDYLKKLESEIERLKEEIKGLRAQLREKQSRKSRLEENVVNARERLEMLDRVSLFGAELVPFQFEDQLSNAISVLPYLSQAISAKKPFDIEKSLEALI